jgi:DNA-binding response OmpR family regulator
MQVVLVVDDEEVVLELLRLTILMDDRYAVLTARTGAEAVEIVRSDGADVMVLDLMIPDMNGIQVLQEVAHLVPTIVLSAIADQPWTVDRCLKAGAKVVMAKPFHPKDLVNAVMSLLEQTAKRDGQPRTSY